MDPPTNTAGIRPDGLLADGVEPAFYQRELYLGSPERSRLLNAYYAVKPLIPRALQLRMRRAYAGRQAAREFPAWPFEPILLEHWHSELRAQIAQTGGAPVPLVNLWPDGLAAACILTHDVEGPLGIELAPSVLEVERQHGFVSSWNFVAEDYTIPPGTFEHLRDAGCEIGLHGINHDGKLFQSRARFEADLPKIRSYLERWDVVGFRSPATHRRAEWMHELGSLYDSSFPDSDPFEPMPGGCCSIHPFLFGDVVELPITLVQDHTLWEILQRASTELWIDKSDWLIRNHGLINLITHPDYFTSPDRLALYAEFLTYLRDQESLWCALPRDVAAWWKAREGLVCERTSDGGARVAGTTDPRATVAWAHDIDGEIVLRESP